MPLLFRPDNKEEGNAILKGENMHISISTLQKLNTTWWILKLTYGLLFIVAGADKFFDLIVHWQKYISPATLNLVNLSSGTFIMLWGIAEIILGLTLLSPRTTKLGAYLAIGLLLLIIANLFTMNQYYDIAVRDLVMAIGAFALAQITTIRERISVDEIM